MVLKDPVSPEQFKSYEHVLNVMGQLSRITYCDAAIAEEVLRSPVFGGFDNKAVNDLITATDSKWSSSRRAPSGLSQNGRPMKSYIGPVQASGGSVMATYISSPDDVTFTVIDAGKLLAPKQSFFKSGDVVLTFKGSSTAANIRHDLLSAVTRAEISPGCYVPGSFLKHLKGSWDIIKVSLSKIGPAKRLFITGHSLGGAYATLCAYLMLLEGTAPPIHLVTFGSPTTMADAARNQFNEFLDSGKATLDRVVSATGGKIVDVIPGIPGGFSHPGFQPLRTEFYPELKTGRAYHIDTVRKVFQGGAFWSGPEKKKYEALTATHMPTKISVSTSIPFAHAGYLGMTFLGAFRLPGMKNPGFTGNTFVADMYDSGMKASYMPSKVQEIQPDATTDESWGSIKVPEPEKGARRKKTARLRKGARRLRTTARK